MTEEEIYTLEKETKKDGGSEFPLDYTTTILPSQKAEIKKKKKNIITFMGDRVCIKMPKFMKEDFFEKKCKDILKFDESPVEKRVKNFYDELPCLKMRKLYNEYTTYDKINKMQIRYFSEFCKFLVSSTYWDNMTLLIIITNSLLTLVSDPNDDKSPNALSDTAFLFIFTGEMIVRIFAYGLIFCEGAYLRDVWNIMDFGIIMIGLITYALGNL